MRLHARQQPTGISATLCHLQVPLQFRNPGRDAEKSGKGEKKAEAEAQIEISAVA